MVYCTKCGKKNDNDAKYCDKCGNPLYSTKKSFEREIGQGFEECFAGFGRVFFILFGIIIVLIGLGIVLSFIFSIAWTVCWWFLPLFIAVMAVIFCLRILTRK